MVFGNWSSSCKISEVKEKEKVHSSTSFTEASYCPDDDVFKSKQTQSQVIDDQQKALHRVEPQVFHPPADWQEPLPRQPPRSSAPPALASSPAPPAPSSSSHRARAPGASFVQGHPGCSLASPRPEVCVTTLLLRYAVYNGQCSIYKPHFREVVWPSRPHPSDKHSRRTIRTSHPSEQS